MIPDKLVCAQLAALLQLRDGLGIILAECTHCIPFFLGGNAVL